MADKDKKTKQDEDKKLYDEMSEYQKNYAEGVNLGLRAPKGTTNTLKNVLKANPLKIKKSKKGIDKGVEDAKKAKEYKKKNMKKGGMVKKCCDGIAKRGKTRGRMV